MMTEAADRSTAAALLGVAQALGLILVVVAAAIAFAFAAVAVASVGLAVLILAGALHLLASDRDSDKRTAAGWVVEANAARQ